MLVLYFRSVKKRWLNVSHSVAETMIWTISFSIMLITMPSNSWENRIVFVWIEDPSVIVCAFTLSNSSIDAKNLPNSRKKKLTENIPYEKRLSSYPATLIGRLGVSKTYRKKGIGTELMDFIKLWLFDPVNKTACRYLTVDAYKRSDSIAHSRSHPRSNPRRG